HQDRPRKTKGITLAELQTNWGQQLTAEERASLGRLATGQPVNTESSEALAQQAVVWAEEHLFERRSVVPEYELWRHALERVRGQNVSLADIQAATARHG